MDDVLARICAAKRDHVAARKAIVSEAAQLEAVKSVAPPRRFAARLDAAVIELGVGLIAEIKKASPSRGLIRADFDPGVLARAYRAGAATCLSVLTDQPYFQGDDAYLGAARNAVDLPVLRKDFMIDPYQIVESRRIGADCILLIMAALTDAMAAELEATARELEMDVLVEVHDEAELDRAHRLDSRLLGINNRNLKTLDVDLATTERLAPRVASDRHVVCESGIYTAADIARMTDVGIRRFLVGESLMRQADVAAATRQLLGLGAVADSTA